MRRRLGSLSPWVLGAALALAAPQPGRAQAGPAQAAEAQPTGTERSPLVAGLLQAALPPLPLGYLYAGSLARGLIPTGLMVGGATLFLFETAELLDWTDEDKSEGLFYLGLGMVVGGYVFGIVDAAQVARRHNAALSAAASALRISPMPSGVRIAIAVPVG